MQTPKSQVDYSNFFSSGFRGIYTRGTRPRATSLYSFSGSIPGASKTPELLHSSFPDSPSSHRRRSFLPHLSLTLPNEEQRRRKIRKLFDRVNEAIPFRRLKDTSKESGISNEDFDDWHSSGSVASGSSEAVSIRIKQVEPQPPTEPIDPFSPAPDTKSIYIDLPVNPSPNSAPPSPATRRSLFVRTQSHPLTRSSSSTPTSSYSLSSPRRSSIRRPASIHGVPTPVSPFSSGFPKVKVKGDKYDKSWRWSLREEVEPVSICATPLAAEERAEWIVDPAEVDWRQFHVELLDE